MKDYNEALKKCSEVKKSSKEAPFRTTMSLEIVGTIHNNSYGVNVNYENVPNMRKQLITHITSVIKEMVDNPNMDVDNPKISQYGWGKLGLPQSFKDKNGR